MNLYQQGLRVVILAASALFTLITTPNFSAANGLQTAPFTEQPATLVGPRADSPIPIYLRPAANQPNVGYGVNGSAVTVLEQVASFLPEADQDTAWNHIRLDDAPYTEGWVQGRFLAISMELPQLSDQLSNQLLETSTDP
ncbi:MAG: hypothetical protein ACFB16_16365 [Phormidesmis sp.]